MWHIFEHRNLSRTCRKLPPQVVKKYEVWKDIVFRHGPRKLRDFPGFCDEKLKGDRVGQRSSRLSVQYRLIYEVEKEIVTVRIIEITPYEY